MTNNIVIDATTKLLEVYLEKNNVPHDRFPAFIQEVNQSILSIVQADLPMPSTVEEATSSTAIATPPKAAAAPKAPTKAPAAPKAAKKTETVSEAVAPAPAPVVEAPAAPVAEVAAEEEPKRGRGRPRTTPDYAAMRETTTLPGLSDDPNADNYRFAVYPRTPKVAIEKSFGDDFVICLLDGRKMRVMKKHLRARYNMSEEQYRTHFGLSEDHPIAAPDFIREKSLMAKSRNFGKKASDLPEAPANEAPVVKRTRSKSSEKVAA